MTILDVFLLVPLVYGAWRGFKKGLIIEVFTLLAIVVGIYMAVRFSDAVSHKINNNLGDAYSATPAVSFTLVFLAVGALIYFGGVALEKVVRAINLSPVNRMLGLVFGAIKSIYLLSILLVTYQSYDPGGKLITHESRETSLLYTPIKNTSIKTIPFLSDSRLYLEGKLDSLENKKIVDPYAKDSIKNSQF
jgi:membrane protein required for colicin V production